MFSIHFDLTRAGALHCGATPGRKISALAVALAMAAFGGNAQASDDGLFGDWGGVRSQLAAEGIDVQAKYKSETAWNPSGGLDQATRYADQWSLAADFDLAKMGGFAGATVHAALTYRGGRNLTDTIGNLVQVQEVYGDGQNFRLADLWYQQTFDEGHWEVRFGRVHVGDDFATFACDFQNLGFCGTPHAIPADAGWADFPLGVWGGRIKFMSGPWYVETGAYQVNPSYALRSNGFKLDFSGTTGVLVPLEVGVLPKLGAQQLPGDYKAGVYYDSSDAPDVYQDVRGRPAALTGLPPRIRDGRYGGYVMLLQQISARSAGSKQGLSVFADVTLADRQTALVRDSLTLGIWYEGPWASRPHDRLEFAVGRYAFNGRLSDYQRLLNTTDAGTVGVQGAETDMTLQYNAQVAKWLTLGPNVQYVIHPNGLDAIPDAFVVGLQVRATL